jgi:hypothetical protein
MHRGAAEKRSSTALRCKPNRSTYIYICLAIRFLRALYLSIFEQPPKQRDFQQYHSMHAFYEISPEPRYN